MHASTLAEPAKPRILVIDDEPGLTQLLSRILRRGYQVTTEGDGRRAVARVVAGECFDLVLCDVMMSPLSGFEVYDAITHVAPSLATRFVLMSGGTPNHELDRRVNGWRHGLLRKPFQVEEVTRLVASCLQRHESATVAP